MRYNCALLTSFGLNKSKLNWMECVIYYCLAFFLTKNMMYFGILILDSCYLSNFVILNMVGKYRLWCIAWIGGMHRICKVRLSSFTLPWNFKTQLFLSLHANQTFSQLCSFDYTTKTVQIHKAPWSIQDKPRFAYRGLMLGEA